jgi:hypothetical protein
MDPVIKSKNICAAWKKYFVGTLPEYAWSYDEGDIYVRQSFMIQIEQKVKDVYIKCLENNGVYDLPPTFIESEEYKLYYKQ